MSSTVSSQQEGRFWGVYKSFDVSYVKDLRQTVTVVVSEVINVNWMLNEVFLLLEQNLDVVVLPHLPNDMSPQKKTEWQNPNLKTVLTSVIISVFHYTHEQPEIFCYLPQRLIIHGSGMDGVLQCRFAKIVFFFFLYATPLVSNATASKLLS